MITPATSPEGSIVYCIDAEGCNLCLEVGNSYVVRRWWSPECVIVVGDDGAADLFDPHRFAPAVA